MLNFFIQFILQVYFLLIDQIPLDQKDDLGTWPMEYKTIFYVLCLIKNTDNCELKKQKIACQLI
jgi:hypothetical protein